MEQNYEKKLYNFNFFFITNHVNMNADNGVFHPTLEVKVPWKSIGI